QRGDAGRAVTDPTGTFAVGGLPPGSYDVAVTADGYSTVTRNGITVDNGQRFPLRIDLHATGSVEEIVRDGAGRALSHALGGRADRDRSGTATSSASRRARPRRWISRTWTPRRTRPDSPARCWSRAARPRPRPGSMASARATGFPSAWA